MEKNSNEYDILTVARLEVNSDLELHIQLLDKTPERQLIFQLFSKLDEEELLVAKESIEFPITLLPELKLVLEELEQLDTIDLPIEQEKVKQSTPRNINFAHESEAEFAKILDFYQIDWLYEPRTFAIRWDEKGEVAESFTPDFYLPEQDQYIELTTLKQELVTKKNRKVRLLKEIYPEVNIKIIYGKDYRKLLEKYKK
ncbi:MAG: hypothetical protein JNN15_06860 [Blastocatellia bacterium]|nr:hypothetical protein [Blastocatellia bacterium]